MKDNKKDYEKINSKTIDKWVDEGWQWGIPITSEEFEKAKNGIWDIYLTPTIPVPKEWFLKLAGIKVLGLASGGAQQMPILSALGANCTVLDFSKKQLESEIEVANREGYSIEVINKSITERLPFEDETFDLIIHPVSNVYVKDVNFVFREAYRVLKKDGILLSGLDNGINYIVDENEKKLTDIALPFDPTSNEELFKRSVKNDWGLQFSHTLEEQIGGQLKAGFTLTDLYEDTNGEGRLHELNIKTYIATRSIK